MLRSHQTAPFRVPLGVLWIVCAWASVGVDDPLHAQTRYSRHLGAEQGLVPASIASLAQDRDGLLWIGTAAGLYRYDGDEMRHWAPQVLRSWVSALGVSPDGTLIALDEGQGAVLTIFLDGATPVPGPDGQPLRRVTHLAVDASGTLWVVRGDEVLYRDSGGRWAAVHRTSLDGATLRKVLAAPGGGAFALTSDAVWHLRPQAVPRRVATVNEPRGVLALPNGRVLVITFHGTVVDVVDGRSHVLLDLDARAIDIVERYGTLWVSFDRFLVALPPGGEPEALGTEDGVPSGGPLLVDHEGALWLGTFAGLLHFPEPDTRIWTERHGLPTAHTRFLAKTGDTVWVNTWGGSAAIAHVGRRWSGWPVREWTSVGKLFVGDDGVLRTGSTGPRPGILEVRGTTITRRYRLPVALYAFAAKADGSQWFGTQHGLLVAPTATSASTPVAGLPFGSDTVPIHAVLHDASGRTWLASERSICQARDGRPSAVASAEWRCDVIPSGHHVSSLLELPSGSVWASLARGGVWRHRDGAWTLLGGYQDRPASDVLGLVPSPSGGVWVVGSVMVARVIEDPEGPDGWQVVEALSGRHGLGDTGSEHIVEEPDGTLWLTTSIGVARVPGTARLAAPPPERVILVDASVDDEAVALSDGLSLPHHRNRLALRFAAVSYRDRSLLRYQVRLSPREPWTAVSGQAVFRWVNLRPGRYRAEVRASLDGRSWTANPAQFAFRVLPPWYSSPWAIALFVTIAVAAAAAAYRARVTFLVGLERQRTRIAMDLHDEMGSGLGSIGILSGMLANEAGDASSRRMLTARIADISEELGTALSDIVWSLDPRSSTLEDVAGRLAEHGARLFSGDTTQFMVRLPDRWPAAPLDFPLRRGLLLIGLEALHNAARHAAARHVTLAIQPGAGGWQLVVEDDGRGLPDVAQRADGFGAGMRNLRRRAKDIGGRIAWSDRAGGGTVVTLDFPVVRRRGVRRRR